MNYRSSHFASLIFLVCLLTSRTLFAQDSFITYQGRLNDAGAPANGLYDVRFSLFDNSSGGAQVGNTVVRTTEISNGLFTAEINFATNFAGANRWLQLEVRTNGVGSSYVILDPRQRVTAAPYSTYALTAGNASSASSVAVGSAVTSLNALKDDVVLQAGSNVTFTPSGNGITIAATGPGGSGIWNLNGTNTYFTTGKVGIGTNTPNHRLRISGGPAWTANGWTGSLEMDNASAIGWRTNVGGQSFGIGPSTGGLYFFRTSSNPGTTGFPANYDMEITDSGNLLVGGGIESPGVKLQVNGSAYFATTGSGGTVSIASPNAESGLSIIGTARADVRFDGSTLKLVAGPVGSPPSSANGVAITTSGNVGIGTTAPNAKLDVTAPYDAIHGTSTGGAIGVYGSSGNVGVYGDGTGNGEGVHGRSVSAPAVNGTSTGGGPGVYGTSASGYAGYFAGNVNVTGTESVQGGLFANGSINTYGGAGYAAIFAHSGGGGLAGNFNGNVFISGTLSKGGGSFKIDHPLDPANKYLYHSFVESPDMMNVYNGNIVLDAAGEATVQMPEWFESLNKEFRYQLTSLGAPGPNLYIAEEIKDNRFKIAGGNAGAKVSWQITGVRHDAFADANRIKVEEAKPENERGTYLHPELFGQPAEKSVTTVQH